MLLISILMYFIMKYGGDKLDISPSDTELLIMNFGEIIVVSFCIGWLVILEKLKNKKTWENKREITKIFVIMCFSVFSVISAYSVIFTVLYIFETFLDVNLYILLKYYVFEFILNIWIGYYIFNTTIDYLDERYYLDIDDINDTLLKKYDLALFYISILGIAGSIKGVQLFPFLENNQLLITILVVIVLPYLRIKKYRK